ncbi:hypothetical protein GOODEAATRI_002961 [Goodea atripinnis]|uniref:UDP-glucuronosyltransferase n=1 Tax=Goodea atripinnis TaxID=208336 RepID=A0ABV0P0Z2_9TELE
MELRLSVCVLLLLCATSSSNGGKILVWYTEASHWINMKPVLETLVDRGHQVTVLVPSASMFMNSSEPSRFQYEPFDVSVSLEAFEELLEEFNHFSMYEIDYMNYFQIYIKYIDIMRTDLQNNLKTLDGVVKSETLMKKLKKENFDLLFADPLLPGSDLAADILGIPLVFSLRFSLAHNWERMCGQLPAPPSFVPGAMSKLTDKMDFSERLWNVLFYALQDVVIDNVMWKMLDKYYSEVKGSNTRIFSWIPQNDLLGHPKTKAFITHGGTNGIYEAIYHGVPMVGIPMFADQSDNMVHMKAKGAAVIQNLNFMTTESLRDAIKMIINDKSILANLNTLKAQPYGAWKHFYSFIHSYKENVMRLSRIHHDRPMSPRDEAVFWIEFTMRHKGAKHLRVQAHELTWYQYHSLDVLTFFITIDLFLIFILFKTCSFCFQRCCGRKTTKRKAE